MKRMIAAAVLAASLLLGGCANGESYSPALATALQSRVLSVTEAAASSDFASALARLDELEVDVRDALARGSITAERHDSILAAIDLVRADLEAAIQAAQKAAEEEAQRQREAEEQARQESEKGNGKGNGGNGKGNGKGNDNGNGNGPGNGGRDDDD